MNIFEPWLHTVLLEDQMLRLLFHLLYSIFKKKILEAKWKYFLEQCMYAVCIQNAEYSIMYQNLLLDSVYRKDLIIQTVSSVLRINKSLVKTNTPANLQSLSLQLSLKLFIFCHPPDTKKPTKNQKAPPPKMLSCSYL